MIAPAVLYLLGSRYLRVSRDDWYSAVQKSCVICLAFLLPVVMYCGISYELSGHFRLSVKGSAAGRMAEAADCATLKASADVLKLCPPPAMQKQSPDWLEHSAKSSLLDLPAALGPERLKLTSEFDHAVERQQPLRVIGSVLRDSLRLYEVHRVPSLAITPIFRWQFQPKLQQYDPEFMVCPMQYNAAHHAPPALCRQRLQRSGREQSLHYLRPARRQGRHHCRPSAAPLVTVGLRRAEAVVWRQGAG